MRRLLIAMYAEAWRERYGAELAALLDDDPPGVRASVDVLRGALMSHLRPLSGVAPSVAARGAVSGSLACFIGFCLVGGGFAKSTEDAPARHAGRLHAAMGDAHLAIVVLALIAAGCLVLAAAPLALRALAIARRSPDGSTGVLLALAPLALGTAAANLGVLALWLRHHRDHPGPVGWSLVLLLGVAVVGAAVTCWAAPRAIMRRATWSISELRLPMVAMTAVSACMVLITGVTALYLAALLIDAPELAGSANGPFAILNLTSSIALQLLVMLGLSVTAVQSGIRGMRAVGARSGVS